ncbi:LGFP repeat-containing protein [Tsukamurella sp. DT100]|uniref:LGFP repeat-containing protein n=1 Tax=Tsukamurella sp. DT100 TaxID=3393415 RepID=UPI003CF7ED27
MRSRIAHVAAAGALALAAAAAVGPVAHADQFIGGKLVRGQIEVTYFALGGPTPQKLWGRTLTDELPDRAGGRFQKFENQSSIYWNPFVDGGNAHQVGGAIETKWGTVGWETGPLRYPVSDERRVTQGGDPVLGWGKEVAGAWNDFQGGKILWSPQGGARIVWGEILRAFDTAGGIAKYGWPVGDEQRTADGRFTQSFQKGTITWPAREQ